MEMEGDNELSFDDNDRCKASRNLEIFAGIFDIGLGMKPDLKGKGIGFSFLKAGIEFVIQHFERNYLRLSVARKNEIQRNGLLRKQPDPFYCDDDGSGKRKRNTTLKYVVGTKFFT